MEAETNEGTTVWYFAAVACRGSSSRNNGLAAVVILTSINVAPMLSLQPGRRDGSNRSSNRHGESLRSELAGSTTAGATPYTSRRTHLPRQAHRCVRYTAVVVAANLGTSPNTVLHRVGTCGTCGQYGHIWRNCALSSRGQPHLNVFTSSGECPVTDAHGADTILIPQQRQHIINPPLI